jgi:maltokinase
MTAGRPADGASAALARRLAPEAVTAGTERRITVDQTNASVVVDEAVIVKWLVPPVPCPHPGTHVLEHLRAVGFSEMPWFFAAEVADGLVVATVSELVPGGVDGWEWFVDELTGWADGAVGSQAVMASARSIGGLVGRLHLALATPSTVFPHPVVTLPRSAELARCRALLDAATVLAAGDSGVVLDERSAAIRATFAGIEEDASTPAFRLHGDLHVGQLLRSGDRLVVTDFDGNPLLDAEARHAARPPVVDVAALVQSVDHAGRVAQHRRPPAAATLEPLIADAAAVTLDEYRTVLAGAGCAELLDVGLLWPLRVAQELHELVYAARHLPRWAYVPTATLRAMFPLTPGEHPS